MKICKTCNMCKKIFKFMVKYLKIKFSCMCCHTWAIKEILNFRKDSQVKYLQNLTMFTEFKDSYLAKILQ